MGAAQIQACGVFEQRYRQNLAGDSCVDNLGDALVLGSKKARLEEQLSNQQAVVPTTTTTATTTLNDEWYLTG